MDIMRNREHLITTGLALVTAVLFVACEHLPHSTTAGDIHYVHIGEHVVPRELRVGPGDEVRWQNDREEPVRLGFLGNTAVKNVTCEKGFQSFGMIEDIVTIRPHDFVSLCFSQTGKVRYNIWWDLEDSRGSISRTATIFIRI
jgi:hypothetical protein